MEKRVLETIKQQQLILPGEKILIAVSGGPDSVALLHVLDTLADELAVSLHIAHLNHGFREDTAEQDADFVFDLSKRLGWPCEVDKWDVPGFLESNSMSPQEGARLLRYHYLTKTVSQVNADRIAMGHHKDDQVETMLLRLLRGSGLMGLAGMPIKRMVESICLIRPLFYITKEEIYKYLEKRQLEYCIDPTNKKTVYLRNHVRHKIIPALEEVNPQIREQLFDTTELLMRDESFIQKQADQVFEKALKVDNANSENIDNIKLNLSILSSADLALVTRVLIKGIKKLGESNFQKIHIDNLLNLINYQVTGTVTLPGDVFGFIDKDMLVLQKGRYGYTVSEYESELKIPGMTYWPFWDCYVEAEIINSYSKVWQTINAHPSEGYLDYDKLVSPIKIRNRQPGDTFTPLGMGHQKKLKDFLIDSKISQLEKDKIPLVVSGDDIAWVGEHRISNHFKITHDTKQILRLRILYNKELDREESGAS